MSDIARLVFKTRILFQSLSHKHAILSISLNDVMTSCYAARALAVFDST